MRIALIHGNDGSDVRVGKTCRSLARLGFDTHFIGWDRRPGAEKEIDLGGATAHVTKMDTDRGRATTAGYSSFLKHVVRWLHRLRPNIVCAVNEELAFAVLPFRGWLYQRLVCDIFDSLSARSGGRPWLVRKALSVAQYFALLGADRLIATDEHRMCLLGRFVDKTVVIENVPEDPGEELACRIPSGPVTIWVGGSLEEIRGLRQLIEAIEPLEDVRIVSAGWPFDAYSSEVFLKHPRVDYRGVVTARQALELAASCDAVFCYYAPVNYYMVNASPNKVHDALSVGRPVVINREVRLSEWVADQQMGYVCNYEDIGCLREAIGALGQGRQGLADFAVRSRRLFMARHHWGQMEQRLSELYTSLSRQDTHA